MLVKGGPVDRWQERLARVVKGMDASPHEHIMGSAPKDVDGSEVSDFALRKKAAFDLQHNDNMIRDRENMLETAGALRIQEPWVSLNVRSNQDIQIKSTKSQGLRTVS